MHDDHWKLTRGAEMRPDGRVCFTVWAPVVRQVGVQYGVRERTVLLQHVSPGLYSVTVTDVRAGDRYMYLLDEDKLRPDPVSRSQPLGVHGPSAVVDPQAFAWTDAAWRGLGLRDLLLYELHVGTFTEAGTFAAIIPHLDYLKHLGVTAIELMPVAEFPGARNWGYDGTHPYAPHSAYGGPHGLKALVDACHAAGLAVALDVVYNHLGPEGNYLRDYGPYFTDRYHTPWGDALSFEGDEGQEVRRYFIDNALYWVTEYHIDILRLDAVHGIFDASPVHVVRELGEAVHAQAERLGRQVVVIAESDLNDNRVISERDAGGWGLDAQWNDDFHHALHVALTKEQHGYYRDFCGGTDLGTALTDGYIYQGQSSEFRRRPHGTPSRHLPGERFVVFSQNHDQVGNRACGERLSALVPLAALKVAAGLVVCAPGVPLLFMGEEYAEPAPFLYFTSHTDHVLARSVSEGRRREFAEAAWHDAVPDRQDPGTFARSKLHHHLRGYEPHRLLLHFYREVIALRKRTPALRSCRRDHMELYNMAPHCLCLRRWATPDDHVLLLASLTDEAQTVTLPRLPGRWQKLLDSECVHYGGGHELPELNSHPDMRTLSLAPFHFALYRRIAS